MRLTSFTFALFFRDDKMSGSDEPDDQEEVNCPICLVAFAGQDIGTPESCDHEFCLTCIQEWAKVNKKPFLRFIV